MIEKELKEEPKKKQHQKNEINLEDSNKQTYTYTSCRVRIEAQIISICQCKRSSKKIKHFYDVSNVENSTN